jgi:hypothetical protein
MAARTAFRLWFGTYVVAVGLLAFIGVYAGSTNAENIWWGIGRWLAGIAAVLTLPAGTVVLPAILYGAEALGLLSVSDFIDAVVAASAWVAAASANGLVLGLAARKLASWHRRRRLSRR